MTATPRRALALGVLGGIASACLLGWAQQLSAESPQSPAGLERSTASAPTTVSATGPATKRASIADLGDPRPAATLARGAVNEPSGLVRSRRYEGVFWTHGDSGSPAEIVAIRADGTVIRSFRIRAANRDWEDISIDDEGNIYLADIGNNRRDAIEPAVLVIREPDPASRFQDAIRPAARYRLRYPNDGPFDAEAIGVLGKQAFVISKRLDGRPAGLFSFPLGEVPPDPVQLRPVGTLDIRVPVTGMDFSADGSRLAVVTVFGPRLFDLDASLPEPERVAKIVDAAPTKQAQLFDLNLEAIAFDGDDVLLLNEAGTVFRMTAAENANPSDNEGTPSRNVPTTRPATK